MKKSIYFLLAIGLLCLVGCSKAHEHVWTEPTCTEPATCEICGITSGVAMGHTWVDATCTEPKHCSECGLTEGEALNHMWVDATCTEPKTCERCGETVGEPLGHKYTEEIIQEGTCTQDEIKKLTCSVCGYSETETTVALGHALEDVWVIEATKDQCGQKYQVCANCDYESKIQNVYTNGFSYHGKLSVQGTDLVDQDGDKFQLIGLSTHGLQWYKGVVNKLTFSSLREKFGINVIRLALYSSEDGYAECTDSEREILYQTVVKGIKICTELDMYVILDWHMVGAENVNDKNPLYYMSYAKEFYSRITEEFKDNENLLFDIMNEPCGDTTWSDCKKYANTIIPVIRANNDGIIICGNPKWTADLDSCIKDPLRGYTNLMYSFHFYAGDGYYPDQITRALNAGLPVFISEHGGMENTGDGPIYEDNIQKWWSYLDERNISYVAWNISNSKGSASIFKQGESYYDASDYYLKEWGLYYKNHVLTRLGLI